MRVNSTLEELQVIKVSSPISVGKLFPDYSYQFNNSEPSQDAADMFKSLQDFIQTNEELALSNIENQEEYIKAFQQAMALTKLWMESLYLK